MYLYSAFFIGLAGSLHCAVMCGPLTLLLPASNRAGFNRVIFNAGRIATYVVLGAIFGLLGRTLVFAGLQRALSIIAGAAVIIGLAASSRIALSRGITSLVTRVKSAFARVLRNRTMGGLFLLGALNGLLPCGLVYVAAALAAASGDVARGMGVMLAFGFGTLPMLLGIAWIKSLPRLRWRGIITCCAALAGVILILRGLSLGIPYLSPSFTANDGPACCHTQP